VRLPPGQHVLQPWKNGFGVSRIIAEAPPGAGFDALAWQVSSTEFGADCPFSSLPGLDRQFTVISGAGVELSCAEPGIVQRIDSLYAPYAFRGDWRTHCRLLDGPVRIFNVMTRRGVCSTRIEIVPADGVKTLRKPAGETLVAVELGTLDAWLLQGVAEESCAYAPARSGDMLALVRLS
jgi:environmental stress-induced protein Ves